MTSAIQQVYGNTPKRERKAIETARSAAITELVERCLPGLTLRYWSPRNGKLFNLSAPAVSRIYIEREGEKVGFLGVRRSGRKTDGYYDRHRYAHGEDLYTTEVECNLPDDVRAALDAAAQELCARNIEWDDDRWTDPDQFEIVYGALA